MYTVRCCYNAISFSNFLTTDTHSSPVRVRYGVSVVSFKSDSCSAAVIAVLLVKLWLSGLHYNGTWLYMPLELHQPRLWFITGGYLVKRWFIPAAARARGQSNDLNRAILASNLFNCHKEVINTPPVQSISRCIHIVYRHKNIWEYQWSNFIHNCMRTFLHYVHCKDALLDCSAPGGERCESLTWVDEIAQMRQIMCTPIH